MTKPDLPVRLFVVGEDLPHWLIATIWVDRRVCEHVTWVERETLSHVREWMHASSTRPWLRVGHQWKSLRRGGFDPHLHGGEWASGPESMTLRRTLFSIHSAGSDERPHVVVLVADDDHVPWRRTTYEAVRAERPWAFRIALATPVPEAEAWLLFAAARTDDQTRLACASLRRSIGIDPAQQPHRLTSRAQTTREAKKVFAEVAPGVDRTQLLEEIPWHALERAPSECMIRSFLDEIDEWVVPLF